MNGLTIHEYGGIEFKNAVAIVGFPSLGLISSIASSFLAKELKMDLVAAVSSPDFPPYAIVQNGVPLPPVRIYGWERKGEKKEESIDYDSVAVITSEFVPKPEMNMDTADLIIDWCRRNDVRLIITLDGIPQLSSDANSIIGVGSTENARSMMKKYEIESFDEGMVRGLSGMILMKAAEEDVDVITLLGSARQDVPDPKGAARILVPLAKMVPELNIDTAPLFTEADEIEQKINSASQNYGNQNIYG